MTTKTRKRLVLLLGLMILLAGYVGSFFAVRKTIVTRELTAVDLSQAAAVTTADRIEIRLHYFSMHPAIHRALYSVYYPIHSFLGSDVALLANGGAALRVNPKLAETYGDYYVVSLSDLRIADPRSDVSLAP